VILSQTVEIKRNATCMYCKLGARLSIEVLHLIQLTVAVYQVRAGGEAELLPEGVAGGVRKTKLRRE